MIPVQEKPKPVSNAKGFLSALDFLKAEKEQSRSFGASEAEFFDNAVKWSAKSDEEKQLCYMDFAERYADYVCGFEKRHSKR